MSCGVGLAKCFLIIFNIIFWLTGAALLGIGIWLRLDRNALSVIDLAYTAEQDNSFEIACYVLIGVGAFVFLVGFLGCCGAMKESKCMLTCYIFFIVVVFAVELVAGILAAVYKDQIMDDLQQNLIKTLDETQYYDESYKPTFWGTTMNVIQNQFKCCGIRNYTDYDNPLFKNQTFNPDMIPYPYTCCEIDDDPKNAKEDDVVDWNSCKTAPPDYSKGCYTSVADWLEEHSTILIGVGIGIACLQIFGFVFAICVCRSIED